MLNLLNSNPLQFVMLVVAMLFSLAFHEFSHAWAATALGDETAKRNGRLTINPLSHIDMFGLLLFFLIGFGWGKPVPFDPNNLKSRRWGSLLVGLAGPAANFVLAITFAIILKIILATADISFDNLAIQFFSDVVIINSLWGVFNLIPIPPLDGSKVLFGLLPDSLDDFKVQFERVGPFALLILIVLDRTTGISFFDGFFSFVLTTVSNFITS